MQPDTNPRYNDMVDALTQAATHTVSYEQEDGTVVTKRELNEESLWCRLLDVDSIHLSDAIFDLKELERQGDMAKNFMCIERAAQIKEDILLFGQSFRRAFDSKGGESRRDKHNAKATSFDKLGRNRVEKIYSLKEEAQKGGISSFLGGKSKGEVYDDER